MIKVSDPLIQICTEDSIDGDGKVEDAKLSYVEGKTEFDRAYLAQSDNFQ